VWLRSGNRHRGCPSSFVAPLGSARAQHPRKKKKRRRRRTCGWWKTDERQKGLRGKRGRERVCVYEGREGERNDREKRVREKRVSGKKEPLDQYQSHSSKMS
jgi:hypothetical protein